MSKSTILIVHPCGPTREALRQLLEGAGYTVQDEGGGHPAEPPAVDDGPCAPLADGTTVRLAVGPPALVAAGADRPDEATRLLQDELERLKRELETFSYSVSHDLRGPLRGIDGFSQALIEDYGHCLDERGRNYLQRVRNAAQRMGELIDDLLELSRVGRAELVRQTVDLSALARAIVKDLSRKHPERDVEVSVDEGLILEADPRLLRVAVENLLSNAWKFTARAARPRIELRAERRGERTVYWVRDNGAGFDMAYVDKLFKPFQRLHSEPDFSGTGIGLATVHRVIDRHGGSVWAESGVGQGATFYFSLRAQGGEAPSSSASQDARK